MGVFAFPEGTRSRTGRMMPFKGGVFAMATKAGVPIVPVYGFGHTQLVTLVTDPFGG